MKKNVGTIDKVVRILIALVLLYLYGADKISGAWAVVAMVVAVVMILTSVMGTCPIFSLLGINSCPVKKAT